MKRLSALVAFCVAFLVGSLLPSVDGQCTQDCFLYQHWNEGGIDYVSKTPVCITYANTPMGGGTCPALTPLGNKCGGFGEVQRATTPVCRCCSGALLWGQNWNANCPAGGYQPFNTTINCLRIGS